MKDLLTIFLLLFMKIIKPLGPVVDLRVHRHPKVGTAQGVKITMFGIILQLDDIFSWIKPHGWDSIYNLFNGIRNSPYQRSVISLLLSTLLPIAINSWPTFSLSRFKQCSQMWIGHSGRILCPSYHTLRLLEHLHETFYVSLNIYLR